MLRLGLDDLVPVVLLAAAAIGVALYNRITGARPGRRHRGTKPPEPPAQPPGGRV